MEVHSDASRIDEINCGRIGILLSVFDRNPVEGVGFLEFCNDFDMLLLRHEGDKTGVVVRVTEVLRDRLCVQGCISRMLLVNYPTSEGKELEFRITVLGQLVQTRKH